MFGGHAKITKDEKVVFNQLISSGVTMRAPDKIDFLLTKYPHVAEFLLTVSKDRFSR